MTSPICAEVQRWLAQSAGSAAPSPELAAHVAACPRCRGALAALLAALLTPPPHKTISCNACIDDLPAWIEREQAQGIAVAARRYPHVLWHLWTCPECAEAAEGIKLLLAAEDEGRIARPPLLVPPQRRPALPTLHLERGFLHAVFAAQFALGARWSDDDDALLITESELSGCGIAIYLRRHDPPYATLEILIEPPVAGTACIRFGDAVFHAALVGGHTARIDGIPSQLLTDTAGPDMQIELELERDDT